jgi:hypothetical protein
MLSRIQPPPRAWAPEREEGACRRGSGLPMHLATGEGGGACVVVDPAAPTRLATGEGRGARVGVDPAAPARLATGEGGGGARRHESNCPHAWPPKREEEGALPCRPALKLGRASATGDEGEGNRREGEGKRAVWFLRGGEGKGRRAVGSSVASGRQR